MQAGSPTTMKGKLMKLTHLVMLSLFTMLAGDAGNAASEVRWHNAAAFEIEGRGWTNTAGIFDRLPDSAKDKVPPIAWDMSKDSAGICIRFVTDAATIGARWSVTRSELAMPHMPATGVSGIDLYARNAKGQWRFVGNGRPYGVDNETAFTFPVGYKAPYECLLYLPLYNGIKSIEISAPSDARLERPSPRPESQRRPVVFYGTSITQGGCVSRPGMACPAILGRMLDRPMINLGFSGSGTMEPPVGDVLAELDPAVYVVDCLWNTGGASQEVYDRKVSGLVKSIRKAHPLTPIVFVGQTMIQPEAHPTDWTLKQEKAVRNLMKQGDKNLILVPGKHLIGDDGEGTVDTVHQNDIGMLRQAECLLPVLRKLLR